MRSKYGHATLGIWAVFAIACFGASGGGDGEAPTKAEVIELLPTGIDMLDERDAQGHARLVGMGDAAYPALAELLDETSDALLVGRILGVFIESDGDKTEATAAVRRLLSRNEINADAKENLRARIAAVNALGRIGSAEDCEILHSLLDEPAERMRINVVRALGAIGSEASITAIEQSMGQRRVRLTEDEQKNDFSFAEGTKAIESIRSRLPKADSR